MKTKKSTKTGSKTARKTAQKTSKKAVKSNKKTTKKTTKKASKPVKVQRVVEQDTTPELEAITADNEPVVKAKVDPATGTVVIAPVDPE